MVVFSCILLQYSNSCYLHISFYSRPHLSITLKSGRLQTLTVHRNSTSVPEAVREILTRNYPVYQCLKMKLVNFHALAEQIQSQVKDVAGKEARVSLSSGIVDVTIRAPRTQFPSIVKELADASTELSEFPNIFPLSSSIKLILPLDDYALVRGKLQPHGQAATMVNVARLTLNLSPRAEMTPGIASYITELLFRNGV